MDDWLGQRARIARWYAMSLGKRFVLDFAKWVGWQAGERKRTPALLSPDTMKKLHTPIIESGVRDSAATRYTEDMQKPAAELYNRFSASTVGAN